MYPKSLWGGPNKGGGTYFRGGSFKLEGTMVSVLHKKNTRIQSGKAQVQEFLGHAAEDLNQIRNKRSRISPHEVLRQSWLINTVYHSLGKNN